MMRKIELKDYDPKWPALFQQEAARLRSMLGNESMLITHIGSTAIPNMTAQPIIDILIGVKDIDAIDDCMREMGYHPTNNHCFYKPNYQVHIFDIENPEVWRHIHFVQYMRAHPHIAQQYATLKQKLAKRFFSTAKYYTTGKAKYIQKINQKAAEWAPNRTLATNRLLLRPFTLEDAPIVQQYAGDKAIAENVSHIPYPLTLETIESWIPAHRNRCAEGKQTVFAITLKETGELIGATSLTIDKTELEAEIGYWIGKPFWNRGYCTEAARAMIQYGFEELYLRRLYATCFHWNHTSVHIMDKLNMTYEEGYDEYIEKWDREETIDKYGLYNPAIQQ